MSARVSRSLALSVALAACGARAHTDRGPACELTAADTDGWKSITSRHGTFAISLPPQAEEVPLPCIDSPCGRITVQDMVISYDSGPLAGPGTELTQVAGTVIDRECRVATAEGRAFRVGLGRYTELITTARPTVEAQDTIRAGAASVQAVMPLGEGRGGLYFFMHSPRPGDRATFVTALRSVRVLRTQ